MVYDPALRTPQADVEERMGVRVLEELLAERDDLVAEAAPLHAKFGSDRTYDVLRKIELSKIAQAHRALAVAESRKITEAAIEEASHADDRYIQWVTEATQAREKLYTLEDRIQGINDQINRGQAIARYLAGELHLS